MKRKLLLLCAAGLLTALARAFAATHYVDAASTNAVPPFTNWATAAANIQDAVDAAAPGDEIVVTNGLYQTGARAVYGMSNRVALTKPVTVRSVNGPAYTSIVGYGPIGDNAIRCAYLTNGAAVAGFTLTNGATQTTEEPEVAPVSSAGGGVWCESQSAVVTNCVLLGNSAYLFGGGAYSGTLNNCTLTGNSASPNEDLGLASGGGAYESTLNNCTLTSNTAYSGNGGGAGWSKLSNCTLTGNQGFNGGGVFSSTLNDCTLTSNGADEGGGADSSTLNKCTLTNNGAYFGGGAVRCTLTNCIITRNLAGEDGGGVFTSTLYNCTLADNWLDDRAHGNGAGATLSVLNNCICFFNAGPNGPDYETSCTLNYSCTPFSPGSGVGNITDEPAFVDLANGNLRLQSNSPCINAGNNAYATGVTDLDGNPRVSGGTVDIGAYEFQSPASRISYAWLQQFGLPTDGSADHMDNDHDGQNNWQEWMAGTDPTNPLSFLRLLPVSRAGAGVTLTWLSVTNRTYVLECSTNLAATPRFTTLATNLPGQPGTTSWTDTNAPLSSPRFYQLRVSP